MFKKKIFVLTFFILMIISSICFADGRWFVLHEDSRGNVSLDTNRISTYGTEKAPYIDCWIKLAIVKDDLTNIEHRYIRVDNLKYMIADFIAYKGDKYVGTINRSNEGWQDPTPGSIEEAVIINTIGWVNGNREKVTVR